MKVERASEEKKSQMMEEGENDDRNTTNDLFQNYMNTAEQQEQSSTSRNAKLLLQNIYFQIFITVLALFSLFSDDIRMAAFPASADFGFDIVHILLICVFLVEIVLNWIALEEYRFSFYFVLDLISSLSILLDISFITDLMYSSNSSSYNLKQLAAQSKASRVATRAVRIVKLVRIIRIVKLYKAASQASDLKQETKRKKMLENKMKQRAKLQKNKEKADNEQMEMVEIQQGGKTPQGFQKGIEETNSNFMDKKDMEEQKKSQENDVSDSLFDSEMLAEMSSKESKISKVLSDLTIQKVIIVVLLIMFIVPLFDSDNYIPTAQSMDFTIKSVKSLLLDANVPVSVISGFISNQISQNKGDNYVIYFTTPYNELPYYKHNTFSVSRLQDMTTSIQTLSISEVNGIRGGTLTLRSDLSSIEDNEIIAVMDYSYNNERIALFSIGQTLFICIVLIGLLHFFTEDINELIVAPIERMMKQVMEMAKNPESASMGVVEGNQYETGIVHNAIVKIGALLSLVFGAAGAEIIGSNIMKQGDMNAMIDGKKKCAIFGFCDIRGFTEVTELLQEDIMMFVNKIGELVHSSVYRYGGSANKNIGEAFLMVWPLPDYTYDLNHKTNQIFWKDENYVRLMGDFSVLSFVKSIIKIHKDPAVLDYKYDPRLISGFGDDFQVKMGFGLHIGWAIEGAIGSEYKIDASYLSPNVNMASRLEAASRQYGVNLLISEDLHKMLTPKMQKFCRFIDRVTVKGSAKPIRLYTVDLKLENISPPADKKLKYKNADEQLDVEIKKEINMEYFEPDRIESYDAEEFVLKKKELREVMINSTTDDFKKRFELGLECYLAGKWADSRLHLTEAAKIGKNDGPTKNILNYMKKFEFVAPQTWQNFRPLTEK